MKHFFAAVAIAGLALSSPFLLQAQGQVTQVPVPNDVNNDHGQNDKGVGNGNYDNGVTQAPFDAGLGILIAAGIGVGVRRAYKKRKLATMEK